MYKRDDTVAIHGHEYFDPISGAFIVPIYQSAIFKHMDEEGRLRSTDRGTDLKYSREENPTVRALEKLLTKLDSGEDALCFCSGMAAISTTLIGLLDKGDKVLITKEAYGTTIELVEDLRKYSIEVEMVYPDTEKILESITKDVKVVFLETMTNPTLKVIDIKEVAKACLDEGVLLIVDNTFVTPILYKPLRDKVSIVIHSTTKYIAGHNDVVGGVVISNRNMIRTLWDWRRKLGGIMSPFDAFLTLRGVKTLGIRMRKHCENAMAIAEYLAEHPKVVEVLYPGLPDSPYHDVANKLFVHKLYGGVVSFRIKGGREEAFKLMKSVKLVKVAPSLGGPESLLTYPIISASKNMRPEVREEVGITEDLMRLSVGLEDVDDIIEDLSNALEGI
ncbi:MAG: cystathionine gamma-synthase family protein [Thermoprotei archaeon]|nr:MAG: cystathionine gamma-synthase family protein [Thermoprotei archaeon]